MAAAHPVSTSRPGSTLLRDFARLLLFAVALPVLVIAALLLWQGRSAARDQFATRLAVTAEMTARDVDTFVQMHVAALQLLAERRSAANDAGDLDAWSRDLERVHRVYPVFNTLAVVDRSGRLTLTQPPLAGAPGNVVADRGYFSEARRTGRPYVSNAYRGRVVNDLPSVAMSAPFYADGRFAGVVAGAIRIDTFPALRPSRQTHDFEMLLVDRNQTVVHASSGLSYRSLDVLGDAPGDRQLRALRPGSDPMRMTPLSAVLRDGGDAYGLVVPLRSGWRLVMLVPESTIAGELRRNALLVLGLLALVLSGALAIVGAQMQQMGRSVLGLLQRIQEFALDRAPAPGEFGDMPRELAPLAEAMNQLSVRCHEAYDKVNLGLREQSRLREELQDMARRLLTVQEDERRTLSRELHDDIGQAITAIKLGALALQDEDDHDGKGRQRTEEILGEIIATTDQTVAKLRNLSMLLRPPQLDTLGLETALRWQAETLFRSGKPRLELALAPLPRRPAAEVELACFRIAQEAMTNILRHSGAATVRLSLAPENRSLRLEIADDGRGFEPGSGQGLGLLTMRERARQVGGTLELESGAGRGTRLRAVLPMEPARNA